MAMTWSAWLLSGFGQYSQVSPYVLHWLFLTVQEWGCSTRIDSRSTLECQTSLWCHISSWYQRENEYTWTHVCSGKKIRNPVCLSNLLIRKSLLWLPSHLYMYCFSIMYYVHLVLGFQLYEIVVIKSLQKNGIWTCRPVWSFKVL